MGKKYHFQAFLKSKNLNFSSFDVMIQLVTSAYLVNYKFLIVKKKTLHTLHLEKKKNP